MKKPITVSIIGGGVIGVTTGIVLNLHGYKTKIYTEHLLNKVNFNKVYKQNPNIASVFAAASIIPHSVEHPKQAEILETSQEFFHRLAFSANCGVLQQRHYELFEFPKDPPKYTNVVRDIAYLSESGNEWTKNKSIPKRKNADGIWGWYFNTFFAAVPTYITRLYELYEAAGGIFILGRINNIEEIKNLNSDVIINCTGASSTKFFPEDKINTKLIKGCMAKVNIYKVPRDINNQYFSYNYTPNSEIYHRYENGEKISSDVLFYPRSDGWCLGGSRQAGELDENGAWKAYEKDDTEMFKKPDWEFPIPKPIWDLNRELISNITEPSIDIANPKYKSASYCGYRFARSPIRIEQDQNMNNKLLFHNYGHGGAGYTLSWGSAYEILRLLEDNINYKPDFLPNEIRNTPNLALLSIIEDLMKEEYIKRSG